MSKKSITKLYPKAWAAVQALRRNKQPALADETEARVSAVMRFYRTGDVSEEATTQYLTAVANRDFDAAIDLPFEGKTIPSIIQ